MTLTLSIIIPTYNSASIIKRALDSIINQTFTNWEVLIQDGISTDNTINIAQSYKDQRIHIYSEPDHGIYDAMNKGINKAHGKWLYFLGSDDFLFSNDVLSKVFNNTLDGIDIFYGDVNSLHLDKRHNGEWSIDTLPYNRCHQAIFYRKEVFNKTGLYNLKYPVLADYALNLQWFLRKDIKKLYLPICIATYSSGGYSEDNYDDALYADYEKILFRYGFWCFDINKKIDIVYAIYNQNKNNFNRILFFLLHKCLIVYRLLFRKHSIILSNNTQK